MVRAGLSTDAVVECAAQLLDERTDDGLNLAVVAERLGVRIPSLYKHIDGMPGIRRGIMIRAKSSLARALGQAAIGRSRDDAVTRMAFAYRHWALNHPGQYPMTMKAPLTCDDEDVAASTSIAEVIFNVLAGYDLHGDDAIDATRFLRSAIHGFIALETTGGFELPVDIERSYRRLVESVVTALATWSRT